MHFFIFCTLMMVVSTSYVGYAQGQQPPVTEIYKNHDGNKDGLLEAGEVTGSRYARQFPRWDVNGDQKVSPQEVIAFRKRFGIAADGTLLRAQKQKIGTPKFVTPKISELKRLRKGVPLSREEARNSAFLLGTEKHAVGGTQYVILTDHVDTAYLKSLKKLAAHHQGQLMSVPDLALLHEQEERFETLQKQLRAIAPKYAAIAPRLESFRENMLMGMWELFSTLDSDPELDVFPGFLMASNAKAFSKLIEQSLQHNPIPIEKLKPIAISQVLRDTETRSLQKAAILRQHFRKRNLETPIVAIYGKKATTAPRLKGKQVWNLEAPGGGKFIESFSAELSSEFNESNLIIMHGHGVPGMSCSVDIQGIPSNLQGKVLLTGSCFSASPKKSDLPEMRDAPGGYTVKKRDAFILRAIDQGAIVAFGHQRLSSGFPHLYPVLENWLEGRTVGEAYQRLINGLINLKEVKSGDFIIREKTKKPAQNSLLYVVIGDPALRPFGK
ncbi:hypothetical protein OAF55_00325 [Akkermansiaceae bacterium]|nr:hypothetical protein [Akkermansiaceae bacterium]